MDTACAWCDDTRDASPSDGRGATSHGMCRSCLGRRLEALRSAPAPRVARRPAADPAGWRWLAPQPA